MAPSIDEIRQVARLVVTPQEADRLSVRHQRRLLEIPRAPGVLHWVLAGHPLLRSGRLLRRPGTPRAPRGYRRERTTGPALEK
jgi:hypothetical protein